MILGRLICYHTDLSHKVIKINVGTELEIYGLDPSLRHNLAWCGLMAE